MIFIIEKIIYCSAVRGVRGVCGPLKDVHWQPHPSCLDIKLRCNSHRCAEIEDNLPSETGPANSLKLIENLKSFLTRSQNFQKIKNCVFFPTLSFNRKIGRWLRKIILSLAFYTGKINSKNCIQIKGTKILPCLEG